LKSRNITKEHLESFLHAPLNTFMPLYGGAADTMHSLPFVDFPSGYVYDFDFVRSNPRYVSFIIEDMRAAGSPPKTVRRSLRRTIEVSAFPEVAIAICVPETVCDSPAVCVVAICREIDLEA
jgi:hypothetical protein